jgi:ElaB/YqjD/DUF883 family membrane-anchored ribosome-binding protein
MNTQSQKLVADIKTLLDDAETLAKATATESSDKIVELRRRVQQTVTEVKPHLATLETAVSRQVSSAVTCTDTYVHNNPWTSMGVSAGIGLVIGLLISRG